MKGVGFRPSLWLWGVQKRASYRREIEREKKIILWLKERGEWKKKRKFTCQMKWDIWKLKKERSLKLVPWHCHDFKAWDQRDVAKMANHPKTLVPRKMAEKKWFSALLFQIHGVRITDSPWQQPIVLGVKEWVGHYPPQNKKIIIMATNHWPKRPSGTLGLWLDCARSALWGRKSRTQHSKLYYRHPPALSAPFINLSLHLIGADSISEMQ